MAGLRKLAFGLEEGFIDQHHGQPVAAVQAAGKALAAPPMLVVLSSPGRPTTSTIFLFDEAQRWRRRKAGSSREGKRGERHRQAPFKILARPVRVKPVEGEHTVPRRAEHFVHAMDGAR